MPELPEVETIKNELSRSVSGLRFTDITVRDSRLVQQPDVERFCSELKGRLVRGIVRRGKYLIFNLSGGKVLVLHLMMSGALLFNPDKKYDRSARVVFHFDSGDRFLFIDRRRLGKAWLSDDAEPIIGKLGIDPLDPEFTVDWFAEVLHGHDMPVKAFLLDQSYIAGIGNMYADEALFEARIYPMRKAQSLSVQEVHALHAAIVSVLNAAIERKGASVDTYMRPGGEPGYAQFDFRVAHRRGDVCVRCGAPIRRIAVRNRGTYFCPHCQKQ